MSYTFTRGLEFCIHEPLVFGKATKSDFFSWFLREWDKRLWELRIGILCVCCKHISQLSPTYYSTITLNLSLDGSIFLHTLPNNLQRSLNEAEYYILPSPYSAASIIVPVLLAPVKFETQPEQHPLYFHPHHKYLCAVQASLSLLRFQPQTHSHKLL
jgi:hypothetical protein